jgi:tetratricopeptide (TPR) repeat protein
MDAPVTIGIIIGILGVSATVFYGITQIRQAKRDSKEIKNMLDTLDKKVDGIAIYQDGLAAMSEKRRRNLLNSGLKAMQEYDYDEAIDYLKRCLESGPKHNEKVALLILIGNCLLSTSRLNEALVKYKEAEKIAREI